MATRTRSARALGETGGANPAPAGQAHRLRSWLKLGLVAAGVAAGLRLAAYLAMPAMDVPDFRAEPSAAQQAAARSDPLRAEVLQLADQVVQDFPSDPPAIYARGLILNRFGSQAEASACWQACLQLAPGYAPALYCLGRNAFDNGEYARCSELMEQALEAEPGMWDALLLAGRARMGLGNMPEAIVALREFVRQSPRSTEGHFRLGQAYLQAGQDAEAAESYRAALAIDPGCKHAHYGLAQVYRRAGDRERAAAQLQTFDQLDSERARVGRGMRRDYDDRAAMRASVSHLHSLVGKVYAAYGRSAQAEQHFRRAAELESAATGQETAP